MGFGVLGPVGLTVMARLMGMLVAAIAAMVIDVRSTIPGFAGYSSL